MNKLDFRIIKSTESSPDTTMVIIGTAENGPSNVPFILTSDRNPYELLGYTPLAKAYVQAKNSGIGNIILYRINGTHSTATLSYRDEDESLTDIFRFRSVSANDLYNSVGEDGNVNEIKVEIDEISLIATNSDGSTRTYILNEYKTASSLADTLNIDASYGLLDFETEVLIPDFPMSMFNEESLFEAMFSGGSTESYLIINRELEEDHSAVISELKSRLIEALFGEVEDDQALKEPNSTLGLLDYAGITIADLFHDDDLELAVLLGSFCQNKSSFSGQGCIAVLGTAPIYRSGDQEVDQVKINTKLENLLSMTPSRGLFSSSGGAEEGAEDQRVSSLNPLHYVQIVVGDALIRDQSSILNGNITNRDDPVSLAFSYLSMILSLPYYMNPTNKRISGIDRLNYEFQKEIVDNLAANGYISIVSSIRKGYVPYLAVTSVGNNSKTSFKKPHYLRISQQISRLLNENLDNIVGTNVKRIAIPSIESRIKELMQNLVDSKAIRGYSVVCELTRYGAELKVSVGFMPHTDVEYVSSITTLPLIQGGI